MDFNEVLDEVAETIMSAVEQSIGSMVIAKGKRLFMVVGINFAFVIFSAIAKLLGVFTFISIKEATVGFLLSIAITLSNSANRKSVEKIARNIKRKGIGYGR